MLILCTNWVTTPGYIEKLIISLIWIICKGASGSVNMDHPYNAKGLKSFQPSWLYRACILGAKINKITYSSDKKTWIKILKIPPKGNCQKCASCDRKKLRKFFTVFFVQKGLKKFRLCHVNRFVLWAIVRIADFCR